MWCDNSVSFVNRCISDGQMCVHFNPGRGWWNIPWPVNCDHWMLNDDYYAITGRGALIGDQRWFNSRKVCDTDKIIYFIVPGNLFFPEMQGWIKGLAVPLDRSAESETDNAKVNRIWRSQVSATSTIELDVVIFTELLAFIHKLYISYP